MPKKVNARTRKHLGAVALVKNDNPSIDDAVMRSMIMEATGLSERRVREIVIIYDKMPKSERDKILIEAHGRESSSPKNELVKALDTDVVPVDHERLPATDEELEQWKQNCFFSPQNYAQWMLRLDELTRSTSDVASKDAIKMLADMYRENRRYDGAPEEVLVEIIE